MPRLLLAPMEGVTDSPMRAFMSERGGFTHCVTEFLRVSDHAIPAKVFRLHVPELEQASLTRAGLPVQVQLLGGNPELLAESAARACMLGAWGIDLNFGCPAPTVNRHDGGAALLKYPLRIRAIVEAVRKAVPADKPVSAKLRLGWDTLDPIHENAERAAEGGVSWITIHGRTRMASYNPPIFWEPIGEVRRRLGIRTVANGDIWTVEDFRRCREITGCEDFMLGRGALADPDLVFRVARELGLAAPESINPIEESPRSWFPHLTRFAELGVPYSDRPHYVLSRLKQWLHYAAARGKISWFDEVKRAETLPDFFRILERLATS